MNTNIPARPKQQKFRPVLTADQISKILELAKTELPLSVDAISLIATLSPFQAKILNQGITPAYTLAPARVKANSLESLGAASAAVDHNPNKEEYWALCYERLQEYGAEHLSLNEIQAAREHMYLNDLMSADEMVEFERAATGEQL